MGENQAPSYNFLKFAYVYLRTWHIMITKKKRKLAIEEKVLNCFRDYLDGRKRRNKIVLLCVLNPRLGATEER